MVISVLHYKLLENTYLYVFTICLSFPKRIYFRRHNVLESVTLYYFENKLETSYGWKFSLLSEHPHPFSESWKWQHRSKYRKKQHGSPKTVAVLYLTYLKQNSSWKLGKVSDCSMLFLTDHSYTRMFWFISKFPKSS